MPSSTRSTVFRWVAGGVVAVVLVLVGVWLGGRGSDSAPMPSASASEPTPGTSTATPEPQPSTSLPADATDEDAAGGQDATPTTYDSACGLSGGTTELPDTAPADVKWQNVDGWYFPTSPSAGPGTGTSCFARTPTGALVAGYTISMLVDGLADDFETVVTEQTVPGVGQTTRLEQGPTERPTTVVVPRGFVLDRYTNDEATMTFYLETAGQKVSCSFTVQWYENDWRVKLQENGQTPGGCIATEPVIFTPWGP